MDQNLCFNIFIFLMILVIIKYISPNPDSVLFVIKKYLNFLIFKINRFLKQLFNISEDFNLINKNDDISLNQRDLTSVKKNFNTSTFKGMNQFQDKAPSFISYHQSVFIQKMIDKNPLLDEKLLKKLYTFIEKMVTIDVDDYFLTVSDSEQQLFSENELNKIKTIIFNKLNSGSFKFTDLNIQGPVVYYNNSSGKEVNPFSFTVNCDNNIGQIQIYISIDIRNDVVRNASYIVIKKLRININNDFDPTANQVNFDITNDVTNKIIYNSKNIENDNIPEKCNNVVQPLYFDNPDNMNLNFNNPDNMNLNFNIDSKEIEIPNYDDILNSYSNEYNILLDKKNSNNINMSMPILDFRKQIKTPTNYESLEPSNINDTIYSILDNANV